MFNETKRCGISLWDFSPAVEGRAQDRPGSPLPPPCPVAGKGEPAPAVGTEPGFVRPNKPPLSGSA